jgi:formylglycine-generating enzyme required for sulfatase activity
VRLQLDSGTEIEWFATPARLISRNGRRLSLEFEWEDAPRQAFSRALYRTAEREAPSRTKGQDVEPVLRA